MSVSRSNPGPRPGAGIAERQAVLMRRFMAWLLTLDETQLAAFTENWGNVMDDAALDRIDSWVIADKTITELRRSRGEPT